MTAPHFDYEDLRKEEASLRKQLKYYVGKLRFYQEKKASIDSSQVSYEIVNEIEEAREESVRVQAELQKVEQQLKNLEMSVYSRDEKVLPIIGIGIIITGNMLTYLTPFTESYDPIKVELTWLFYAADYFIKTRQGFDNSEGILSLSIPEGATVDDDRTSLTLNNADETLLHNLETSVCGVMVDFKNTILKLNTLLDEQAHQGGVGTINTVYEIDSQFKQIVQLLQKLNELVKQLYGVNVLAPDELAGLFYYMGSLLRF